jgi:general secretion pathway protein J
MALKNYTKPNKNQKGMTLLEVLVAMTLMVIISAMSYASLNGLIDAKIHTDEVALGIRQELMTSQQLSKDIHAMIKRRIRNEFGEYVTAIIGGYISLEFTRNGHSNPLNIHRSDLQRVQWFIQDNQLFRRSIDILDVGSFPQWQQRKYMDNVKEFNINYISATGQESRNWPLENQRVRLKFIQFNLELNNETSIKFLLKPGS